MDVECIPFAGRPCSFRLANGHMERWFILDDGGAPGIGDENALADWLTPHLRHAAFE